MKRVNKQFDSLVLAACLVEKLSLAGQKVTARGLVARELTEAEKRRSIRVGRLTAHLIAKQFL